MLSLCTQAPNHGSSTNSTVGIQLDGTVIEFVEFGGPAFFSGMCVGDVVVKIDEEEVTEASVGAALVGCDQPGSCVKIEYRKGSANEKMTAKLMRISIEEMRTRSAIFESLQEKTLLTQDQQGSFVLDHELVNAILESIQKLSAGSPVRSPDSFVSPRHTYINSQFLRCASLPHDYSIPVMEKLQRSEDSLAASRCQSAGSDDAEGSPKKFSILSRFQSNLQLGFARQITETNAWKSPKKYVLREQARVATTPSSGGSSSDLNDSDLSLEDVHHGFASKIHNCEELASKIERAVESAQAHLSAPSCSAKSAADLKDPHGSPRRSHELLGYCIPDMNGTAVGYKFEHSKPQEESDPADPAGRGLNAEILSVRKLNKEASEATAASEGQKGSRSYRDEVLVTRVIRHYQKNHEEIAELMALRKMKTFLEEKISKLNENLHKSKKENAEVYARLDQLRKESMDWKTTARDLRKKLNSCKSDLFQVKEDYANLKELCSSKERDVMAMEAKAYILQTSEDIKAKTLSAELMHTKRNVTAMNAICNELKQSLHQTDHAMGILEGELQQERERTRRLLAEISAKEMDIEDLKQNLHSCESSHLSSADEARQAFNWMQRKLLAAHEEISDLSRTCEELRRTSLRVQEEKSCDSSVHESEKRWVLQQVQTLERGLGGLIGLTAEAMADTRRQEANEVKVAEKLMRLAEDIEKIDLKLKEAAKLQATAQDLLASKSATADLLARSIGDVQQELEGERKRHAQEMQDREEEVKSVRSKLQSITQDMTQSITQSRLILNKCDEERRAALREVATLKNENEMLHHELEAKILDNIASHRRHQQLISYFTSQVARVEADTLQLESLTRGNRR